MGSNEMCATCQVFTFLSNSIYFFLLLLSFEYSSFREITFENAEELTEEGLPFLILFHSSDDLESIKNYKTIVETQLISEKRKYSHNLSNNN